MYEHINYIMTYISNTCYCLNHKSYKILKKQSSSTFFILDPQHNPSIANISTNLSTVSVHSTEGKGMPLTIHQWCYSTFPDQSSCSIYLWLSLINIGWNYSNTIKILLFREGNWSCMGFCLQFIKKFDFPLSPLHLPTTKAKSS